MTDVESCPSCGHDEPMTEFGADMMLNYYYTDFYCPECDYSGRLYRMDFGPEVFGMMDERGIEPAAGDNLLLDD